MERPVALHSPFQPQPIGGLVEDGFRVLGRCYWKLLPLAAATSGVTFLATWLIARSALVDGSFVEEKVVIRYSVAQTCAPARRQSARIRSHRW